MYLDTLVYQKGTLSIGIIELENENHLDTGQLLELISDVGLSVEALQLFDGSKIVDSHHLLTASQNAINAWYGDYAQTRSLSVEIAVFASGQHQIGRALSAFGVTDSVRTIAAVVVASSKKEVKQVLSQLLNKIGRQSEPEFPNDRERLLQIMELFDIRETEIATLSESKAPDDIQKALSKCVVSRVSNVAFDI